MNIPILEGGVKEETEMHGHQDNQHQWPNKRLEVLQRTVIKL